MPDTRPFVVTLGLADADQERLDALRRAHFPPERNHLGAHVTLFHALPGDRAGEVGTLVADAAHRPPFDVAVTGVRRLGRGVALVMASDDLAALHRALLTRAQDAFGERITPQDRQRLSPHVTVQNKVEPDVARALHERLSATFAPWAVRATGLQLWRYAGGPWEPVGTEPFTRTTATA